MFYGNTGEAMITDEQLEQIEAPLQDINLSGIALEDDRVRSYDEFMTFVEMHVLLYKAGLTFAINLN